MRELGRQFEAGKKICILGRPYKGNWGKKRFLDIRLYDKSKSLVENLSNPILADHLYLNPINLSDFIGFCHYGRDLVILEGIVSNYFRLHINAIDAGLEECKILRWYAFNNKLSSKCFMVLDYKNNTVDVRECYPNTKFFRKVFNPYIPISCFDIMHGYVETNHGAEYF